MQPRPPIRLAAIACRTSLGDAERTCTALCAGENALRLRPALGPDGGEPVPTALAGDRSWEETTPPNWLPALDALAAEVPDAPWGRPRHPVFLTSSNFGVGGLHAYHRSGDLRFLAYGAPGQTADRLRLRFGWGPDVTLVSHACVSAHAGLLLAARAIEGGLADRALVFSFDFLSPFVTGGFQALKILNDRMPAPYDERPAGSIGLGDGAAFAVLEPGGGEFTLARQTLHNEMHHFTANRPDGAGFEACLSPLAASAAGRRVWAKGHGTGTLEAGRLEAQALARLFPDAPLVSWKGGIGHTLGSCGLVELAIAVAAIRAGRTPGTVGAEGPSFTPTVARASFANRSFDAVVLAGNAFGGAHAACLLCHG